MRNHIHMKKKKIALTLINAAKEFQLQTKTFRARKGDPANPSLRRENSSPEKPSQNCLARLIVLNRQCARNATYSLFPISIRLVYPTRFRTCLTPSRQPGSSPRSGQGKDGRELKPRHHLNLRSMLLVTTLGPQEQEQATLSSPNSHVRRVSVSARCSPRTQA